MGLSQVSQFIEMGITQKKPGPYYFGNGDLINDDNIMVKPGRYRRWEISGVVDWECAGWWDKDKEGQLVNYNGSWL